MKDLIDIGFQTVGAWDLGPQGIELRLESMKHASPALYAFVVREDVRYVGKTARPLQRRLYNYLKPGDTQLTNIRVRQLILQTLGAGDPVSIMAFADAREQRIGRFLLNLPAGLEDDIIRQLRPAWNGRAEREFTAASAEAANPSDEAEAPQSTASAPTREQSPPAAPTAPKAIRPSFTVTIGRTYFRQGFFNVPVDYARYFAAHGADIRITVPGHPTPIVGHINRTVNANDTPRIMGGVRLRDWLQERLRLNGRLRVVVVNPQEIEVRPE